MGLTLEFLIGEKAAIVKAVENENFEVLDLIEESGLYSDFSLHISPTDLDLLFLVISDHLGKDPISLRDNLDTIDCYSDHPDRGAFLSKI